jgi:hypothetical protein
VMISAVTCRDHIASTSFPTIVRILIIQSDSTLYDCARTAERRLVTSDDMAHLELEDEHGTTAYVHVSFVDAAPLTHRIEALGSKGRLTIDGNRLRGAQLPAIDDSVLVENEQADVRFRRERDRHRQREREREIQVHSHMHTYAHSVLALKRLRPRPSLLALCARAASYPCCVWSACMCVCVCLCACAHIGRRCGRAGSCAAGPLSDGHGAVCPRAAGVFGRRPGPRPGRRRHHR